MWSASVASVCLFGALLMLPSCSPEMPDPADGKVPTSGWDKTLPPSDTTLTAQRRRGLRVVRGIIHLHSVYSHDACDNDPQPLGKPNAPCSLHLRQGLCQTRQDFALLSDHSTLMADSPWTSLFLQEAGDEAQVENGEQIGSVLHCTSVTGMAGHKIHLAVGGENRLMPLGLHRHVGNTVMERREAMNGESAEAVRRFLAEGAAVFVPHGESRSLDLLRTLAEAGLTGMEIYNLHANLDPKIRAEHLGIDGLGAVAGLWPWFLLRKLEEGGPEPDLAVLGFLDDNRNQLGKYDALLSEGKRLTAIFGSDIHENSFKQELVDGERGDSYRRLMRWFSNHVLVNREAPLTSTAIVSALRAGRSYGAFEIFGTPVGFDVVGESPMGSVELGGTAKGSLTLRVSPPNLELAAKQARPEILVRILYRGRGAKETVEVASQRYGELSAMDEVHHVATAPGAYRVEVRIRPRHLFAYLGEEPKDKYDKEYPYLYTSPIYLDP